MQEELRTFDCNILWDIVIIIIGQPKLDGKTTHYITSNN